MCYGWALITLVYHYNFGHDMVYVIRVPFHVPWYCYMYTYISPYWRNG